MNGMLRQSILQTPPAARNPKASPDTALYRLRDKRRGADPAAAMARYAA